MFKTQSRGLHSSPNQSVQINDLRNYRIGNNSAYDPANPSKAAFNSAFQQPIAYLAPAVMAFTFIAAVRGKQCEFTTIGEKIRQERAAQ